MKGIKELQPRERNILKEFYEDLLDYSIYNLEIGNEIY